MKFFIPAAQDEAQAESVYESIKQFAQQNTGWAIGKNRIYKIEYTHEGRHYHAEVGKVENRVGELCVAILDSNTYLVCTPNRGVARGGPILVGKNEVTSITYFKD